MYIEIVKLVRMDRFSILSRCFVHFTGEQRNGRLITMLLFLKLTFCPTGMLQCTMNTKCTSNFALELPEAIVHISSEECMQGL